jgi:ABC-2 type transport system ATP-binding protein
MQMKSQNISISIRELTKAYGDNKGIFDFNTNFNNGQINLITGSNGSGKTTLLRCIMKLVQYKGEINRRKVKIGYAPENYLMPEYLTVNEFLYSIGRIKGLTKNEYNNNKIDFFELFNIKQYQNKLIKSLSNGTKQKVNLIQALIHEPKIIILDEPLVSLDYLSQVNLLRYLNSIAKIKLVIISTHNPEKFRSRIKKIYHLENGRLDDKLS